MISNVRPAPHCTRGVNGARLTQEGVFPVERMEAATFQLLRAESGAPSGSIRVAVTEGLGTFRLLPRLVEAQQGFPRIVVDLHCAMRSALADVSRQEADVAIQPSWPAVLDVKPVRICRMHLTLFASEIHPNAASKRHRNAPRARAPRSLLDLARHRLVLQITDGAATSV